MKGKEAEELLLQIQESFGLTKYDFKENADRLKVPIYTKWGDAEKYTDLENLGEKSLKISKNLGDIYIEKIRTDKWIVVGRGTTLHCDDMEAGESIVLNFQGFLM